MGWFWRTMNVLQSRRFVANVHNAKKNFMMKKTVFKSIDLTCIFQQEDEQFSHKCFNGVISKAKGGFRFEEAVRRGNAKRNPKLFDGRFCSLVHMQNGRYKIHMKSIDASGDFNRQELAFKVYSELLNAFNHID